MKIINLHFLFIAFVQVQQQHNHQVSTYFFNKLLIKGFRASMCQVSKPHFDDISFKLFSIGHSFILGLIYGRTMLLL